MQAISTDKDLMQKDESPQNEVERLLIEAKAGRIALDDFLRALLAGELLILSVTEIKEDGSGMSPLLSDRNGVPMAVVFTTSERATLHADKAPYLLRMNGRALLSRVPVGYGIVLNPGHAVGLEIVPQGIKEILSDLA